MFRNETCVILIDVMKDANRDKFKPWMIYATAMNITHRCTQSAFRFDGRTLIESKKIVGTQISNSTPPCFVLILESQTNLLKQIAAHTPEACFIYAGCVP